MGQHTFLDCYPSDIGELEILTRLVTRGGADLVVGPDTHRRW